MSTVVSASALVTLFLRAAPTAAQSPTVSIVDFGFAPGSVQAPMGPAEPGFPQPHAHVGFFNNGAVQHNVTFDDGRVQSSPALNPNQFFDAVLTVAGSFSFHCSIHPNMQGAITVTPLPTTTTSTTTTEPPTTVAPPTVPAATAPPASTAPTVTTTRPRTTVASATTRPPAGAVTSTTTAVLPTVPPDATTVPVTEPPPTTAAVTTEVRDSVALAAPSDPAESSPWPLVLAVLAALGGGGWFVGRTIWTRRRDQVER